MEQDNWENRSEEMGCHSCMHYISFRCRRHAPTMQGYPAVYGDDWCGDHKMSKDYMEEQC